MVEEELRDGPRIAELLAAEVEGHSTPPLGRLSVVDADPDARGTPGGEPVFRLARDGERVAEAYVHDDRVRLELAAGLDEAREAAIDAGLRVRPKAVRPPKLLVFVENGAEVKHVLPVLERVAGAVD